MSGERNVQNVKIKGYTMIYNKYAMIFNKHSNLLAATAALTIAFAVGSATSVLASDPLQSNGHSVALKSAEDFMQDQIAHWKGRAAELEIELTAADAEAVQLLDQGNQVAQAFTSTFATLKSLKDDHANLKTTHSTLQQGHSSLEAEHANLGAEKNRLQSALDDLKREQEIQEALKKQQAVAAAAQEAERAARAERERKEFERIQAETAAGKAARAKEKVALEARKAALSAAIALAQSQNTN